MKTIIISMLLIVAFTAVLTEAHLSARRKNDTAESTEPPTVSSKKGSSVSVTSTEPLTGSSRRGSSAPVTSTEPPSGSSRRGSSKDTVSSTTSSSVSSGNNKGNDTQSRNKVTKIGLIGHPDAPGNYAGVSGRSYKIQA